MDTVFIDNLGVDCIVGIYEHERQNPQRICFDIRAQFDNQKSARCDDIGSTVDYHHMSNVVRDYVAASDDFLLETLIEAVASIILQQFAVTEVTVRVCKKKVIENVDAVGIQITRRAQKLPILLALGSNVQPEQNIRQALALLKAEFGALVVSRIYQNPAVGFAGLDFYNAAVRFESNYSASVLYRKLHQLEVQMGRDASWHKNQNRPIDLDLLAIGQQRIHLPYLHLPRANLLNAAYILAPVADVAFDLCPAGQNQTYPQLWQQWAKANPQAAAALKIVQLD